MTTALPLASGRQPRGHSPRDLRRGHPRPSFRGVRRWQLERCAIAFLQSHQFSRSPLGKSPRRALRPWTRFHHGAFRRVVPPACYERLLHTAMRRVIRLFSWWSILSGPQGDREVDRESLALRLVPRVIDEGLWRVGCGDGDRRSFFECWKVGNRVFMKTLR